MFEFLFMMVSECVLNMSKFNEINLKSMWDIGIPLLRLCFIAIFKNWTAICSLEVFYHYTKITLRGFMTHRIMKPLHINVCIINIFFEAGYTYCMSSWKQFNFNFIYKLNLKKSVFDLKNLWICTVKKFTNAFY